MNYEKSGSDDSIGCEHIIWGFSQNLFLLAFEKISTRFSGGVQGLVMI